MLGEGPMHVLGIARLLAKACVEVRHELGRKGIGRLDRVDAAQAQLLYKPVLQRLIGALDAPLGLWSVGADDVDVELIKRAAKLRQAAGAILLRAMGRSKDAMLVTIESQRLAPFPQIRLGGVEVVERVLGAGKTQMKQLAGRIVDEDEQGALWATTLEPP